MSIRIFTSRDVAELIGITPVHLNAFVQRKLYGIKPSISGRGQKVRVFGEGDLFGIALVWTLFQSGLRTQQIRTILKCLAGTGGDAKDTAQYLLENPDARYIVFIREESKPKRKWKLEEDVGRAQQYELAEIIQKSPTATVLLIPIGAKFDDLKERIATLFLRRTE